MSEGYPRGLRRHRVLRRNACYSNQCHGARETRAPGHALERDDDEGEMEIRLVLSLSIRMPILII